MGKLRRLASDTTYYGISHIAGRAIYFLLLPFYTTSGILTAADFGEVGDIYAKIAFLNIFYLFGMETTYFRFSSKKGINESDVFSNAQTNIILASVTISGSLILFDTEIVNYFKLPGKEILLQLAAMVMLVDALVAMPFAKLRYQQKAKTFATYKLIIIGLNVFFNVFFLFVCRKLFYAGDGQLWHRFISIIFIPHFKAEYVLISNLLANLFYFILLRKQLAAFRFSINSKLLKEMLLYAYPLVITGLAGMINEMFSRGFFIKLLPTNFYPNMSSKEALGVLSASFRLAALMTLATQGFRYAVEPFFFSQSEEKDSKITFAKVFYYFVLAGCIAILIISMNLDILKIIFLRQEIYWQGIYLVPFLMLSGLLLGIYFNFSIWFKLTDKTYYGILIGGTGSILTVVLNVLFIPRFGYNAAAIIPIIIYLIMATMTLIFGKKHYPIPYDLIKVSAYILTTMLLIWACWHIDFDSLILNQIFKNTIVVLFLLGVFLRERKALRL